MRRMLSFALLAAAVLAAAPASAQRYRDRDRYYDDDRPTGIEGRTILGLHLGPSSPTSDFGDEFDSGLGFGASIGHGVSDRVLISANLSHHEFDHEVFDDETVSITPITFNADYMFSSRSRLLPFVGGGIGMYHVNDEITGFPDEDESSFGFNFGAGIAGPIARRTLLGAGFRWHFISGDNLPDSEFFTFQVGLGFTL